MYIMHHVLSGFEHTIRRRAIHSEFIMPEITWEHSNRSAVQGHSRPVTYLTFDDSGKVLYTCGKDTAALRRAMQRQWKRASNILERKVPEDAPSISC